MSKKNFYKILESELKRVDRAFVAKRKENVIDSFSSDISPAAVIKGKKYSIFNSNDYLGLRFARELRIAEEKASRQYGTGPGAVRFISGTFSLYKQLEKAIARFHKREDGMVFSSAFAANLAVIACMAKGQSKDSLVSSDTFIISS